MNTFERDKEYIANTYARFPLEIVSGKGALLKGNDGKEYIDMGSGIAVNSFGTCDDVWVNAVKAQLDKFQHTSNLFYSAPCTELAEMLCKKTGMKKVFFGNSGAEANECAIKCARKYAETKKGKEYCNIITLKDSFHGRTLATLAATGQDHYHEEFTPMPGGFLYADKTLESVKKLANENKVAAVMFETVQGEGGVIPLDKQFVKDVCAFAKENDIIVIVDEVQTGNGRTGMLYGYMNFGIEPDIVSTAKGLGGGLPIGATLIGEKCKDVYQPGDHGSTFGANPVVCAGALSILSRIDEKMLCEIREKSEYIVDQLKNAPGVNDVSGLGLMLGIDTKKDVAEVIAKCRENGVLVLKAKNRVRLLPPLNIDRKTLEKAVEVIKNACAE